MSAPDGSTVVEGNPHQQVTVHRSNPETFVFVEKHNTDGWIATDLTVTLSQ